MKLDDIATNIEMKGELPVAFDIKLGGSDMEDALAFEKGMQLHMKTAPLNQHPIYAKLAGIGMNTPWKYAISVSEHESDYVIYHCVYDGGNLP